MTNSEYRENVLRTLNTERKPDPIYDELHMVLGMVTEASEIADVYKKLIAYQKPLDEVNIQEELGDLLWFIDGFCYFKGYDIDKIKQMNIDKLAKRYPEKFSVEQALNRDLNLERTSLESNNNIQ